jgi:hypothetical protein
LVGVVGTIGGGKQAVGSGGAIETGAAAAVAAHSRPASCLPFSAEGAEAMNGGRRDARGEGLAFGKARSQRKGA